MISLREMSVKILFEKLNNMLQNEKYTNQVQLLSEQFRDNLVHPMEESMYWIEFVARHKYNYPIFKPTAPNISWFTYLYLDILLVVITLLYITLQLTKFALKKVWERFDSDQSIKRKSQ